MFDKHFGNYLSTKNLVTPEQLADALNTHDSNHVKLGVLAINAGYLSASQVAAIHEEQKKVDMKFGELAVNMGLLTQEQLEELLGTQQQWHLLLGQTLIEKQYMSFEEVESALDGYKKEHGLSELQFKSFREGNIDDIVSTLITTGDPSLKKLYQDYISLFVRSVIRFLDDEPYLETNLSVSEYSPPCLVYQNITGKVNLFTAIGCGEQDMIELAAKFAHESFSEVNKWVKASASEFLNLHNGIFLVNMSNNGIELEMSPQQTIEKVEISKLDKACIVPFNLSEGKIDVIVSVETPDFRY